MDFVKMETMRIYLIRCSETHRVKIGLAKDPGKRLREHQIGSPTRLDLVQTWEIPNDSRFNIEARIHRLAKAYHLHGEWFSAPAEQTMRNVVETFQKF